MLIYLLLFLEVSAVRRQNESKVYILAEGACHLTNEITTKIFLW